MAGLHILDGNCFLHAGDANFSKDFKWCGFPTSGIYVLMRKICDLTAHKESFVVVFDSPSFRKSINSDYKKSRKVNNKILAQANAIIPELKKAGVNVLQVPEFEGDDLIANIIKHNKEMETYIYTCDYDIAINVRKNVTVIGCINTFPTIKSTNFECTVRDWTGNGVIPYNTIGVHKCIFGCSGDEVIGIDDDWADSIWYTYTNYVERNYTALNKSPLVTSSVAKKFFNMIKDKIPETVYRKLMENVILVFPRYLTDDEISRYDLKLTGFEYPDSTDLTEVCGMFGLKGCYSLLMRNTENFEALTEDYKSVMFKLAEEYKAQAPAIDAELPFGYEIEYNGSDFGTDEFISDDAYNEAVHGVNIGGY